MRRNRGRKHMNSNQRKSSRRPGQRHRNTGRKTERIYYVGGYVV